MMFKLEYFLKIKTTDILRFFCFDPLEPQNYYTWNIGWNCLGGGIQYLLPTMNEPKLFFGDFFHFARAFCGTGPRKYFMRIF